MTYKVNFLKRILLMFLVVWITFISVFGAYQKSVEAAEWVAGTIAAIGGAPILSALLIGGVVVAGGVAVYELSQTTAEDHRNFVDGIKTGFQEFVAEREKQIALEQDSSLSDQQAADRGVAAARETLSNFVSNAIEVTRTTGKNLKTKTVEYWNSFCKDVSSVADNGISSSGSVEFNESTVFRPFIRNEAGINISATPLENTGANCFTVGGNWYAYKGKVYTNAYGERNINYAPDSNYYYVPIYWYVYNVPGNPAGGSERTDRESFRILKFNKSTGDYVSYQELWVSNLGGSFDMFINSAVSKTSIPMFFILGSEAVTYFSNLCANWQSSLKVNASVGSVVPTWKRTINTTLSNTHIGSSIRSGRRAKLQSGDYIGSTFVEDSIPVKKTALKVGDATTVGKVGWDIPQPDIWDDVYSGGRPFSDVVRDTGVIGVPSDDVSSYPTDTEVEFPTDTDVQDADDVIDIPIDDEIEIPERPLPEIIEEQEGDFYPTEMDLTQLFPFCIPFDIIYLVDKFDISGGSAPIISFPIKYPQAIQSAMGSDRYVVTIDLGDYVVVRDVIRIFLLLLFIIGLMKMTRGIIRG